MQRENENLRDQLFDMHRDRYRSNLMLTQKSSVQSPPKSRKEAVARTVQESLNAHRTLQLLRLEHRDLLRRRADLNDLIARYKKASRYRLLVEEAKQDIADLSEEHRDVQLEVRCNEKLLVMSSEVMEHGEGTHRLQQEMRACNALAKRQREHALRDADGAQRKRDAAQKRVSELQETIDERRSACSGGMYADVEELQKQSKAKKKRIHDLKAQISEIQARQHELGAGAYQVPRSSHKTDDAERHYLESRIEQMKVDIERIDHEEQQRQEQEQQIQQQLQQQLQRQHQQAPAVEPVAKTSPQPSVGVAPAPKAPTSNATGGSSTTIPIPVPPIPSSSAAQPAPKPVTDAPPEIDVSAWLNLNDPGRTTDNAVSDGPSSTANHSQHRDSPLKTTEPTPHPSTAKPTSSNNNLHSPKASSGVDDAVPSWLDADNTQKPKSTMEVNSHPRSHASSDKSASHSSGVSDEKPFLEESVAEDEMEEMTDDESYEDETPPASSPGAAAFTSTAPPAAASGNDEDPDWLKF